jgi:hypothetical protein
MDTLTSSSLHDGVGVRLTLDADHEVGGTAIRATLIVTNRTQRHLHIPSCPADGVLSVGLESQAISFVPTNGLVACSMTIDRVVSTFPVEISTSYEGCGGTGVPRCRHGRDPVPPLPPGTYRTTITLAGVPDAVEPPPLTVTVTVLKAPR